MTATKQAPAGTCPACGAAGCTDRRVLASWQVQRIKAILTWGKTSNAPQWWVDRTVETVLRTEEVLHDER